MIIKAYHPLRRIKSDADSEMRDLVFGQLIPRLSSFWVFSGRWLLTIEYETSICLFIGICLPQGEGLACPLS